MSDGVEIGKVYTGKVKKIMEYGAFVNILPGKDGLVHISQISDERVNNVRDVMAEGDDVQVKVLDIDGQGRVKLTMKDLSQLLHTVHTKHQQWSQEMEKF